jgi:F-type H+-transporting ATPase subunit alpha
LTEKTLDVDDVLRVMRDELRRGDQSVRIGKVAPLQRIRDAVAARSGHSGVRTDAQALLDVVGEKASELSIQTRFYDVGTVQRIGSGVATLSGLPGACTEELVTFPTGVQGMVLNLDHEYIDVILLGADEGIQGGDLVTGTGRRLRVPVGRELLGRVVNPLGEPLDELGPVQVAELRHLERRAPRVIERAPVDTPLHAGVKIIDALVPIGRGQRELIIGDRQLGKTALALDAILSQKGRGVFCVYVAIGQKKSSVVRVVETLRDHGALAYSTVVVSGPDDPPALRYLAPYAGCTMAEFLMDAGQDVLVVYDDLSKHADAYRELSLLLRRPPGREAYPGDIFYLHARLLERACKLGLEMGGGSLTALPIAETQQGNIASYIPTNLIAITDGQIVLDAGLFNQGVKPAVNVGLSVSRVGGAAQSPAVRALAGNLRLDLAQFEEVSRFARFGAEVDEATQQQIRRGQRLRTVLTQPPARPLSLADEVILLLAASEGYLDGIELRAIPAMESELLNHVRTHQPQLYDELERQGELSDEARSRLLALFAEHLASLSQPRQE